MGVVNQRRRPGVIYFQAIFSVLNPLTFFSQIFPHTMLRAASLPE
jgi:hypothetical protein